MIDDHSFRLKVSLELVVPCGVVVTPFTKACFFFHYTLCSSSFAVICKPAGVRGNSMYSGNVRLCHASSHTCTMPMKVSRLQVGDHTSDIALTIVFRRLRRPESSI